jgi:peptidoglycan/LPS O-acetylase OafA/YrhL
MQETIAIPAAQPSQARAHLPYLDGLRALAALYVVLHHIWLQVWPPEYDRVPPPHAARATEWLFFGHYAVTFFLVISGFCLMLPVTRRGELRGGWKEFYRRRAVRILPPYYLAMAFSLLLITAAIGYKTGTHWDISVPVTAKGFGIHLLLLQNLIPSSEINHVFWSTAVEFQIYLWFPLLVLSWRRLGSAATAIIASVIGAALYKAAAHFNVPVECPHYIGVFAIGMFAASVCSESGAPWTRLRSLPWGIGAAAGSLAVILLCAHFGTARPHTEPMDFVVAVVAAAFLIHGYLAPESLWNRALALRPLTTMGLFSYSIYLVHAPLIQVVWQYLIHPRGLSETATFLALIAIGIPAIVAISYLFYAVCERPFVTTKAHPAKIEPQS